MQSALNWPVAQPRWNLPLLCYHKIYFRFRFCLLFVSAHDCVFFFFLPALLRYDFHAMKFTTLCAQLDDFWQLFAILCSPLHSSYRTLFVSHLEIGGHLDCFQFLIVMNLMTIFGMYLYTVTHHLVIFRENSDLGARLVYYGLKSLQ